MATQNTKKLLRQVETALRQLSTAMKTLDSARLALSNEAAQAQALSSGNSKSTKQASAKAAPAKAAPAKATPPKATDTGKLKAKAPIPLTISNREIVKPSKKK